MNTAYIEYDGGALRRAVRDDIGAGRRQVLERKEEDGIRICGGALRRAVRDDIGAGRRQVLERKEEDGIRI